MSEKRFAEYSPYDVAFIRNRHSRAAVLLARALAWNVIVRRGNPVRLVARDGHVVNIPSDQTGVRESVWKGWIHQIINHAPDDMLLPMRTVHRINKEAKLDPMAHNEIKRYACDAATWEEPQQEPAPEPVLVEPPTAHAVDESEPYVVSEHPHQVTYGTRRVDSQALLDVVWSDGSTTLACLMCKAPVQSNQSLGGHLRKHHPEYKGPGKNYAKALAHAQYPDMPTYASPKTRKKRASTKTKTNNNKETANTMPAPEPSTTLTTPSLGAALDGLITEYVGTRTADLTAANQRLMDENTKLRETLIALRELAGEALDG